MMKIVYEKNMRNSLRNLHKAINNKNVEEIKRYLATDIALDSFYSGKIASQVALQLGEYEICSLLFKSGSDINLPIEDGNILLHLSLEENNFEKINFLLENGADPDIANYLDQTSLHIACQNGDVAIAKLIIEKTNYINRCDVKGETALFKCVVKGFIEIVKLLIDNEADIEWTDNEGNTPLLKAIEANQLAVVELLVERGCNVNVQNKFFKSPLMLACKLNHLPTVQCLLSHKANVDLPDLKKNTAFTEAVLSSHLDIVDELMACGCNVNLPSFPLQQTAFHYCIAKSSAIYGQKDKHTALFYRLIKSPGLLVNTQDQLGCSPLYLACLNAQEEMAERLLSMGALTDVETFQKETILHACVLGSCTKLISRFLAEDMDVNALNLKKQGCLYMAIDRRASLEVISTLIEKGSVLDVVETEGNLTPLHCAVVKKNIQAVQLLTAAGCDVNIPNKAGNSPLWSACEQKEEAIARVLLKCPSIDIELGNSPLHVSIRSKNMALVKMLLSAKINLNRLSVDFKSPVLMAVEQESVAMVALLLKCGADPSAHHRLNRFTSGCCFIHKDNHPHMEIEPLFVALQNDCIRTSTLLVLASYHYPLLELTTLRDILFRTSYIREAKLSEKSIVQFAHFFSRLLSTPRSLKESCRGLVRRSLGQYPEGKIHQLSVPDSIKNYIRFTSIDRLLPK